MSIGMGLLSRIWPQLAILAVVLAALYFVDRRGYDRAEANAAAEKAERQLERVQLIADLDRQLDAQFNGIETKLASRMGAIDKGDRNNVRPLIQRELLRDPRLADPNSCLSPGLLEAVNAARGHPVGAGETPPVAGSKGAVPRSAIRH